MADNSLDDGVPRRGRMRGHAGRRRGRLFAAASVAVMVVLAAVGCTSDSSDDEAPQGGSESGTIALLLPETQTTRYESADRPYFEARMAKICPDCKVLYSNADQDSAAQQNQAEQAMTNGAKVLVLDPVDGEAAAVIARNARDRGVRVVSYDRLIQKAPVDAYISFDNEKVGQLQGQALLDAIGDRAGAGKVIMINGSQDDPNAQQFKDGALSVLEGKVTIGFDTFTPDWSPDTAGREMDQAITTVGRENIVGVYAANDGIAGAVVAALRRANVNPLPPVTGQDAELAGVQRVLAGDQHMTVYKAIRPEAEQAADLALALLRGEPVDTIATGRVDNGNGQVPAVLLEPVAVTRDTVAETVVKDGFLAKADLCAGTYAAACASAGIS
ncbi:substrate-binding domain-containing protein [Frankia sp. Mgl5]|uniref:sugar ABC transporter substrate-binding protein n=1 Tax=Frankia sp. Mgl5 TaxID=2933793 RepID=UPI0020103287|nr:substrate-binding domain-containing protein [Frankia sp. Mgl5]MCK9928201.1 substrate-binding domain-containing protein [Frankia sp. Mgl5]